MHIHLKQQKKRRRLVVLFTTLGVLVNKCNKLYPPTSYCITGYIPRTEPLKNPFSFYLSRCEFDMYTQRNNSKSPTLYITTVYRPYYNIYLLIYCQISIIILLAYFQITSLNFRGLGAA